MMQVLAPAFRPASALEVSDWVESLARDKLAERALVLTEIDRGAQPPDAESRVDARPASEVTQRREVDGTPTAQLPAASELAPRRRTIRVVISAASILALGGLGILLARPVAAPVGRAGMPSPTSAADAAISAVRVDEARESPPVVDPLPSSASAVPPSATSHPHRALPPAPAARASSRGGCDPPYTTDADGTRHYKLQCL
jgi:hypothetical protein